MTQYQSVRDKERAARLEKWAVWALKIVGLLIISHVIAMQFWGIYLYIMASY